MQIFAKSDIGRERQANEDSFYVSTDSDSINLFILADGMGGYNGGEVASKLAVESVKEYVYKNFDFNVLTHDSILSLLKAALIYANKQVYDRSISKKSLRGMGTTLDVCLIIKNKLYMAHIGDSRIYRLRKNYLRLLTKDHSYVEQLIEDGEISEEEAEHHPERNKLTKALGCMPNIEPDAGYKNFQKEDIILMCSDGLTKMLNEEEIKNIIQEDIETSAENLVEKANDNGGYDNITVIIVK